MKWKIIPGKGCDTAFKIMKDYKCWLLFASLSSASPPKYFQVFLSQYLMMSLSGNIVKRTFMWNIKEKRVKVTILGVYEFLIAFKMELERARPQGQAEKSKNRPRFKPYFCVFWAVQHWANHCHDFTPYSPQLWNVCHRTDAMEVSWWLH